MFIPSTFKRPVSSWKALNLRKTLLMASSVRLKPLNCSRLPCVYAQETLTFLLTQKKTCVKNYVHIQEPPSGDLQERVLIRHHDYDQCFQSVQLLQWNSQVKFNVTVYRNLPTTRDSIMTS